MLFKILSNSLSSDFDSYLGLYLSCDLSNNESSNMNSNIIVKKIIIFCLILFSHSQIFFFTQSKSFYKNDQEPLLVIVLMVKNEEKVIKETLQPFIDAGLQHYLIFDTGSTDKTVEITKQFFKENNIEHGIIKHEPFINFAKSRNRAIELAEQEFPSGHFMLMLDAEWYMTGVQELIDFCKEKIYDTNHSYLIRIILDKSLDFYTARLIRFFSGVRFCGAVHEVLNVVTTIKAPNTILFEAIRSNDGKEKSAKRWARDKDLLLKDHAENPDCPRTIFYLAQTYYCLSEYKNAIFWYKKRCEINGWLEENFMAIYNLAQIYERIGKWEKAQKYYLNAFSYRPSRAEPLIKIAQHYYQNGNHQLCYLFLKIANDIPYPKDDILFVDKELYDYTRYNLMGISAWYVGKYIDGKEALIKAIENRPNMNNLKKNLSFYE